MVAVLGNKVVEARAIQKHAFQFLGESNDIARHERSVQVVERVAAAGNLGEATGDLRGIELGDLAIGYAQRVDIARQGRIVSREIPGKVQHRPYRLRCHRQVGEHDAGIQGRSHGATRFGKRVETLQHLIAGIRDETAQHRVR